MEMLQVLVAVKDDDEAVRESLLDLLEVSGYFVETFASATEFLESSRTLDARCLVLDISMPGMSGIDLYKELKRRNIAIPVLFMTGHAQEALIREAKRAVCLFKPFAGAELRTPIETALAV
jgi:FixJ family two-component response regulator